MHRTRILTGVAAAALIVAAPAALTSNGAGLSPIPPAQAQQVRVSFDIFYDRLDDHGQWVRYDPYGYVWVPTAVEADWAPYTHGRWIYTDRYGWYFTSDEPFSWAAYHYGRWGFDADIGWFWVPGTEWAPAWVAWRTGPDYVGWAPLPPRRDGVSVSVSIDIGSRDLPRPYWHFVPVRQFVSPRLETVIVRGHREPDIFQRTEFLGPVNVEGDLVVNNIVETTYIEQHIEQEIVTYNINVEDEPGPEVVEDNTIRAFQAEVAEAPDAEPEQVMEAEQVAQEAPTARQIDEAELQAFEAEDGEAAGQQLTEEPAEDGEAAGQQLTEEPEDGEATRRQLTEEPEDGEATRRQLTEEPEDGEATRQQLTEEPAEDGEAAGQQLTEEPAEDGEAAGQQLTDEPEDGEATRRQLTEEAEDGEAAGQQLTEEPAEEPEAAEGPEGVEGEAEGRPALEAPEPQPETEAVEPPPQPEQDPEAAPEPEPQEEELPPQQQ